MQQLGGTGIIGQDMVCGFSNGKYTQFEGTEIVAENCVKAKVKDLVVEGKTYQNLAILKEDIRQYGSNGISKEIFLETNSINITTTTINNGTSGFVFNAELYLFKPSTQYTLECYIDFTTTNITVANLKEIPNKSASITLGALKSGNNKITFRTSADLNYLAIGYTSTTLDDVVKINNIKILEGDYTNIDLPNSINGIESVGEREGNLVTIRNYNYKCETDNVVLPNGIKNSIETIDGKKVHIQRVLKIVLDGTATKATISRPWCCPSADYNSWFFTRYDSQLGGGRPSCISSDPNFPFRGQNDLNLNKGAIRTGDDYSYKLAITIRNDLLEEVSLNGINNYLKKNPITVHISCKPIYTYLESGLYDEITIPTSGIKNEIYSENGKWYHKRNIGKVVFDGSDDEQWNNDINNRFKCNVSIKAKLYDKRFPVYAEGYHFKSEQVHEDKLLFLFNNSKLIELYVYNYAYTTVNAFKAYLAENPLEVYYELAEPVISELPFSDITYKLNEPLRSLPNGVCDTIEGNRLIQRVVKVVLDGSDDEYWVNGYGSGDGKNNRFEVGFNYAMSVTTNRTIYGLSDKFSYYKTAGIPPSGCFRMVLNTTNRLFILFNPSTDLVPLEDLSAWKAWLSENPVTVYYELETPIIHDLEIPQLSTTKGTNVITTTNNIKPNLKMKVKVKK